MKNRWIVAWRYNDREYSDDFEFYHTALAKVLQLEEYGIKASIHMRHEELSTDPRRI